MQRKTGKERDGIRDVVLHPAIVDHLTDQMQSLPVSFLTVLSEAPKDLLLQDLKEALNKWDHIASCTRNNLFKDAEASCYSDLNLSYGKADVTVAAKLLVPTEWVYEWETKQNEAFGIKPLGESASIGIHRCRFGLTKPLVIAGQEEKGASADRDPSHPPPSRQGFGWER
jgi:hypothetical protein